VAKKVKDNEEAGRVGSAFMTLLIVMIWLGVIIILIKLDIGGVGSNVLRPVLKDVPILKEILPDVTDDELLSQGVYPFTNIAEAITTYELMQAELLQCKDTIKSQETTIEEQAKEIERLKYFEDDQLRYEQLWKEFHDKVVYTDNAPGLEEYIAWYETIDPTYAEFLYRQAIDQLAFTKDLADYVDAYSRMKPARAAEIMLEMTGNLDTVATILDGMKPAARADILGEMAKLDPILTAKITVLMEPEE